MIWLSSPPSSKPIEINVSFCSLGVCRGSMALEWVSRWNIPPSAFTPSPETSVLTHRNTCMSWSMENSQVRLKRCMKTYLWSQITLNISWILTDARALMLVHISITSLLLLLLSIIIIETNIVVKYNLRSFEPQTPLTLAPELLLDFSGTLNLSPISLEFSFSRSLTRCKLFTCHR